MDAKDPANTHFLTGGGEMGKLTREKDWSFTYLGAPHTWQQSLRTTLSIILNSKFPMFLFWGPDHICFYNDAYRPSLGIEGKHPAMLGMKGAEAWPEIWPIIKPLIDQVLAGGEATWNEDQLIPIYRNGKIEDVYWTFSYSPVNDESGRPAGVFVTCSETTEKVVVYNRLEESKNELEFAIDAAGLGTWDYNPITDKFSANERLKNWFGLAAEDQIELSHAVNAILDSDKPRVKAAIEKALDFSSGGNYDIEYTIVHPHSKKETIVRAKGKAWFDDYKTAYRFNGTLDDVTLQVTARKQIEASEARFRSLITQSPMAMVVFRGPEQIIEIANSAMLKRWDKVAQNIENKRFVDVFPEVRRHKFPELLDAVYRTGNVYRETESVSLIQEENSKKTSYVDFEYAPLLEADGKISGVIATVTDVSEKVNARKEIEESEARYHNLIYSSPSAIGILSGPDFIITIGNNAIIDIWGKGKEIVGKPYFEALPELAEQGHRQVFEEVYQTRMPFNAIEMPLSILQNGAMTLRYYNFLLYPQKNIDGEINGIGIIATEVTSQALLNNKIKESEKKFRLLADSMPQHIWTSDPDGNLNYFNQSVFDYSGLSAEQINEGGWLQIVHPDDREKNIKEWANAVTTGSDFLLEHRFRKYTGEYRWQLSRAVPQKDEHGNIQMWVGTSTDIEDQKNFANALELLIQERTKELEDKNLELEKMNKELQSFAYISSHDLQEPLRKIQTFASRLAEKEAANLSDTGKEYFKRMQDSAWRMQTLIDDLLAYSRTNTFERKYESTDLNNIVDEVKADLQEELQQKAATIETSALCEISIIRFQFRQLLHNLVSNSLKFSHPARPPHIKISGEIGLGASFDNDELTGETTYCHIAVSDNGIGFEPQFSSKIFELFQRLHGRQEYNGTGIGLAIVKKIVENHDGVITATGVLNEGATFDIYIPV